MKLTREEVRKVRCPECGAGPGVRCASLRKSGLRYRESNHQARVNRAQASLAGGGRGRGQ